MRDRRCCVPFPKTGPDTPGQGPRSPVPPTADDNGRRLKTCGYEGDSRPLAHRPVPFPSFLAVETQHPLGLRGRGVGDVRRVSPGIEALFVVSTRQYFP